jgi:hypothetical protein
MGPVAAGLEPYTADSVERYLSVGLTRPVYTGPIDGVAYVDDDGHLEIAGTVTAEQWPLLRAWCDRMTGMEDDR